jgi:AbrB family looped-hinge helix DNA binding protein
VWHILRMAHSDPFPVQLGDRGRLVLPAEIRRRLNLREGDELLVTVQPDGSLRLASPRQAVRETRGLYRARAGNRSLSDELIAERRAEVKRQTSKS